VAVLFALIALSNPVCLKITGDTALHTAVDHHAVGKAVGALVAVQICHFLITGAKF
jgi:hypothetical protein